MTLPKTSAGFTLIELLLVIVLVAVATAATLSFFGPSRENSRAMAFARDLEVLIDNTRRQYAAEENYAALNNPIALARGLFPEHMAVNAFSARDPWGRTVGITPWPWTGSAQVLNTQFSITVFRPGDEACVPLAIALLRMAPAEFLITSPTAATVASPTLRPTTTLISGMAQAACASNTSVGTGAWRVVFD